MTTQQTLTINIQDPQVLSQIVLQTMKSSWENLLQQPWKNSLSIQLEYVPMVPSSTPMELIKPYGVIVQTTPMTTPH